MWVLRRLTKLKIVACVKQVLDPEIAPKDFRVEGKKPVAGNAKLVMDPYSENALEAGIQLKEKAGATLAALCLGEKSAEEVLRRALALTCDEATLVSDPEAADRDGMAIAHILGAAIKKEGGADLVFVGRQAGDWDGGQVGALLAEELGYACITLAATAEPAGDGWLKLLREAEDGYESVQVKLPAVVTFTSHEKNVIRIPKVKDVMMAHRKPIKSLTTGELALDADRLQPGISLESLSVPQLDGKCEVIEGDGGPDKASALAKKLRELKLV